MTEGKEANYEIGVLLRRAHRRAAETFDDALRPLEIQGKHFGVLLALRRMGPLSQRRLIEYLGTDKSSMVRLIDELEARELCVREPSAEDRRAYAVRVTENGLELLATAEKTAEKVARQLGDGMTAEEWHTLEALLRQFIDAGTTSED